MPISVTWDNEEKTILLRKVTKPWSWQDYIEAMKVVHQKLSEVDHMVDIIVDCTEINNLPDGALGSLSKSNRAYPENMGQQFVVSSSLFIELFSNMLAGMTNNNKSFFIHKHTIEEAYEEIKLLRTPTE